MTVEILLMFNERMNTRYLAYRPNWQVTGTSQPIPYECPYRRGAIDGGCGERCPHFEVHSDGRVQLTCGSGRIIRLGYREC